MPRTRRCAAASSCRATGWSSARSRTTDESLAKAAWLRFIALGEPEQELRRVHGTETWAFVRRGPYAAFAVAEAGVRPGVMVDQLEQAMLTAEEGRTRRDTLRVPDAANAPSGKPRTSLHPGSKDAKDGKDGKGKDKDKDRDRAKPVEVAADRHPPRPSEPVRRRGPGCVGADPHDRRRGASHAPTPTEVSPTQTVVEPATPVPGRGARAGARSGVADRAQEGASGLIGGRLQRRGGGDGGRPGPARQRVLAIASDGLRR